MRNKIMLLATAAIVWPLMAHAQLSVPSSTPAVGPDAGTIVNGSTTMPKGDDTKSKWKEMTPEQRQAKHAEMKAKFDAMTPEQKTQFLKDHPKLAERIKQRQENGGQKVGQGEGKGKWKDLTPEQREAKKAEMKKKWDAMTPDQQAAFKAKHPNFGKRNGAGNGDDGANYKQGDTVNVPETTGTTPPVVTTTPAVK